MLRLLPCCALLAVQALAADPHALPAGPVLPGDEGFAPVPRLQEAPAPDVREATPLHWAALAGDLHEVARLVAFGADVAATETVYGGESPLHWAAIGDNPLVVRRLLAVGADLHALDDDGESALHEALRGNDPRFRTLLALLSAGADPDGASELGWAPLHEAALLKSDGGRQAVWILRSFGADPTVRDLGGATPLHYLAGQPLGWFSGHFLIEAGWDPHGRVADLNAQDSTGHTPLHYLIGLFASSLDPRVAEWLVNQGANPELENHNGESAMDWAVKRGHHELIDVFLTYDPSAPDDQ